VDIVSLIGAVSTARPISIHVVIGIPLPGKRNDINYLFSRLVLCNFCKIEKQK